MLNKRTILGSIVVALFVVVAFLATAGAPGSSMAKDTSKAKIPEVVSPSGQVETAIVAGGCFWCVQPPFDKTKGVLSTTVGYAGGAEQDPSYRNVAMGLTGHTEAIRVDFDPTQISYSQILDIFWRIHDPTDGGGQFVDRGSQYRPAIFYMNAAQQEIAQQSKAKLSQSKRFSKSIKTEISQAGVFWPAEVYHQAYYTKNPTDYYRYRRGSGRDQFIEKYWAEEK